VLFLSSCTKFSKNSNVSMGSQKQGRKDQSQTRIREKCNDTHSSQVGWEPYLFPANSTVTKTLDMQQKGSKPWLHTKHATDFMKKKYIHEHRMQPDDAWDSETWFVYLTRRIYTKREMKRQLRENRWCEETKKKHRCIELGKRENQTDLCD
jgi:hypothetical protein